MVRSGSERLSAVGLGTWENDDHDRCSAIAETHGVSEARVSPAWLRERRRRAIPKATSEAHPRDNVASCDLRLDESAIAAVDAIERERRHYDPAYAPDWS